MADVKPADVYVGVVELFSVLLPGAFLTGALVVAAPVDPAAFSPLLDEAEAQWAAFGLVAYALGALVFSFAAEIDALYNDYRKQRWPNQPRDAFDQATDLRAKFFDVSRRGPPKPSRPVPALLRAFLFVIAALSWVKPLDPPKPDPKPGGPPAPPVDLPQVDLDEPMNTFNWAKTLLALRVPSALADVQRYEAESKFFRSLVLVLPLMGLLGLVHWLWTCDLLLAAGAIVLPLLLVPLCFRRYAERRRKSTDWAYYYVIGYIQGLKALPAEPPPPPNPLPVGAGAGQPPDPGAKPRK